MRFCKILLSMIFLVSFAGCDRIYGVLHKPGGEERQILGAFAFNEYSAKVEELQKILQAFGFNIGKPDGRFGASTREAVARFQAGEGLKVTRFVDKATWARMQEYLQGPFFRNGVLNVRAVQKALGAAGFPSGAADGQLGKRTHEAVKAFQRAQHLTPDGYLGLRTLKALRPYAPGSPGETRGAQPR
jgi:peptidoglycan hydrolase-like protein with peptidoglycan-binding domain